MPYTRHCDILECVKATIEAGMATIPNADPYTLIDDVRIEDFNETAKPSFGIIVSPEKETETIGTNERDDLVYSVLVTRVISAMHNTDMCKRLSHRALIRLLFHRKRLTCIPGCHLISDVEFGQVAIPRAWVQDNQSISIMRVNFLVRESRDLP